MGYKKEYRKIISKADGLELDLLMLVPENEVKGVLQIHHGMSEYKERYLPFMEYMAQAGFAAVIHDCRGHGRSVKNSGDLGYMYGAGADGLVEDAHQITLDLKCIWPELPLILFGHSMGSLAVRTYVKKYDRDIDLLVVCGSPSKNPFLGVGKMLVKLQKKRKGDRHLGKLVEAMSFGAYARKFAGEKSRFAWCCSVPEVVANYDASPLCGFTFTVDGYEALFQLMERTYSEKGWVCGNPSLPVLFVGGGDDPCIGGSRKYAQAVQHMRHVGYRNTKGKLYPGMRHEILNEKGKHQVFSDILKYVQKELDIG